MLAVDQQFPLAAVEVAALDLEVDPLDIVDPVDLLLRVIYRHRQGLVQVLVDDDYPLAPVEIRTLDTGIRGVAVHPVYMAGEDQVYLVISLVFVRRRNGIIASSKYI